MVGLSLLAYALDSLQDHVAAIDCDRVKTGIEGLSGNKGGLCVRFMLGSMSLCFANVHLPSGTGKADERNDHLNEAVLAWCSRAMSTGCLFHDVRCPRRCCPMHFRGHPETVPRDQQRMASTELLFTRLWSTI